MFIDSFREIPFIFLGLYLWTTNLELLCKCLTPKNLGSKSRIRQYLLDAVSFVVQKRQHNVLLNKYLFYKYIKLKFKELG